MSYVALDLTGVDQRQVSSRPDLVPADPDARRELARVVAFDAVVYGLPAAYQYAQMCRQDRDSGQEPGQLVHERHLARSGFAAFRVPNVDTLYSNAWLDLRGGPVVVDLPDFGDRYFTLNLLDAFGNASNISRRTVGDARQVWLVPPTGTWEVPATAAGLRVGSELMWVLMRVQVRGQGDEAEVHRLQDAVVLRRPDAPGGVAGRVGPERAVVPIDPDDLATDWVAFFQALDGALRLAGIPAEDVVLVRRFALLGLTGAEDFAPERLGPEVRAGAAAGFADAIRLLDACRPQLGEPVASGWTKVCDKGAHGANHLNRAVMNHVGLAANVVEENTSYNTYADGDGRPLDGATTRYEVRLETPPPAGAFWSVTLYDGEGLLVDNPIDRYAVGSALPGLVVDPDGSVTIAIGADDERGDPNWLPCPRGRFFLVLRIYQPGPEALSGAWLPGPVCPVAPVSS
ncbi:DUF1254 domain-containing protein [Pimelobacter simplex]|uniref:Putative exported protein n=1 Tax=Nocardioides simplex TaxID=2045 RepID=A0A0C5XB64_NOCSI|nr:DUF1254 domain-containing protein [Pimelobacter simplex]AJR18039.1 putative exported protein [Pimelobacter simplex]MCG8154513.1 DUF1254 domain-containing protein [Pimelobacter simplex]GEB12562.1 hypothetical protein NSI01_08770 [Pimelobacter simplex]SFM93264.1 Uncharacterized conserved protein [Pimelobacter simplex]